MLFITYTVSENITTGTEYPINPEGDKHDPSAFVAD